MYSNALNLVEKSLFVVIKNYVQHKNLLVFCKRLQNSINLDSRRREVGHDS